MRWIAALTLTLAGWATVGCTTCYTCDGIGGPCGGWSRAGTGFPTGSACPQPAPALDGPPVNERLPEDRQPPRPLR